MKRAISILLVLIMCFSVFAGCGNSGTATTTAAATTAAPTTAAATTTGAAASGNGPVIFPESYTFKLANATPDGDVKDRACKEFKRLVEERTGGSVTIEVYSGGQLGDWKDTIEGLRLGINEIVIESLGSMSAFSDYANIDTTPYIYKNYDHYMAVMQSDLFAEIMDTVTSDGGFIAFGPMYRGVRMTSCTRPFTNLAGLKGMKFRVPPSPSILETFTLLGAAPTPLALSETFTALQQKTVEAQENAVGEAYSFGFYDVCDYLVRTDHAYSTDMFIFDRAFFHKLPAELQTILQEAAEETALWRSEITRGEEEDYIQKWKDEGVTVLELDDFDEFVTACEPFFDEGKFPYLKDWADRIKAFPY